MNIKVIWGTQVPNPHGAIDPLFRTLTQEFGSAKKAAEFAADLVYMLAGPVTSCAWSDKDYLLSARVSKCGWEAADRAHWVSVERTDYAPGGSRGESGAETQQQNRP